jgi:hypothetical protein
MRSYQVPHDRSRKKDVDWQKDVVPEEIADVALMPTCNGHLTGHTIYVNGGW